MTAIACCKQATQNLKRSSPSFSFKRTSARACRRSPAVVPWSAHPDALRASLQQTMSNISTRRAKPARQCDGGFKSSNPYSYEAADTQPQPFLSNLRHTCRDTDLMGTVSAVWLSLQPAQGRVAVACPGAAWALNLENLCEACRSGLPQRPCEQLHGRRARPTREGLQPRRERLQPVRRRLQPSHSASAIRHGC